MMDAATDNVSQGARKVPYEVAQRLIATRFSIAEEAGTPYGSNATRPAGKVARMLAKLLDRHKPQR